MGEKEKRRRRHGSQKSSSSKRRKKEYDTSSSSSSSSETASQTDRSSSPSSDPSSSQDEEEVGRRRRHLSKRRSREKVSSRKREYTPSSSSDSSSESGSPDRSSSSSFDSEQDAEGKSGHRRRHGSKTRKTEKRLRHGSKKRRRDADDLARKAKGKDRARDKKRKRSKYRGLRKHREPVALETVAEAGLDPIQVVSDILNDFPGIAPDLSKLLERIDEGEAIDLSGLPNKPLAAALERLFQSLNLHESKKGLYLVLPEDHQRRSDILGPILKKPSNEMEDNSSHHNPSQADLVPEQNPDIDITLETAQETKKRVLGPAMPSAEMLEAAARLTEAEALLREAEQELELEPLIGPAPPALVIESENANEAERFEEVTRILSPDNQNAYELLGVGRGVSGEALKKRYWKLSLMVHPDKCKHPLAQEAFTAVNQALKDLQDSNKRALIDRKIEEKEAKEEYEAELKAKRDAAIWRKIRGEPLSGDELLLDDGPKTKTRDEWMTTLPPERKAGPPSMQSTFFSKSEKSGRGDTSVWTDTPLDKAMKAKTEYLEAYNKASLTAAEDKEASNPTKVPSRMAKMMDEFNGARRSVSLLEKHEKQKQKQKKQKQEAHVSYKPRKEMKKQEKEDWQDKHPWKPWDRERDLAAGRQNVKLDAANISAGLSSRFASSQTERSFL